MPETETSYEHIILDEHDVPIIEGTTMKIIELAGAAIANTWSPETRRVPPALRLSGSLSCAAAISMYCPPDAARERAPRNERYSSGITAQRIR